MVASRVFLAGALLGALLAGGGCSSGDPTPPGTHDARADSPYIPFPDFSYPMIDFFQPTYDRGTPGDGSQPASDSGGCTAPSATCSATCSSTQICTQALGGTCVEELKLVGDAADKEALVAISIAYAQCWQKYSPNKKDQLCNALNTCEMTGSLTMKGIKDWVCNDAQSTDFPSTALYEAARGVVACGMAIDRPDWKIGSLTGDEKGRICLSYDFRATIFQKDVLLVDECKNFVP